MRYGQILILGIVFAPVYLMLLGWFIGRPRDLRLALIGVGYLTTITVGLWVGLAIFAAILGAIFF
jgi:hypothetical protein